MVRSLFSRDLFAELDRLQREVQQAFELTPSIRGFGRSGFPALNVGTTPQSTATRPSSTSIMKATEVTGLVMLAIRKMDVSSIAREDPSRAAP